MEYMKEVLMGEWAFSKKMGLGGRTCSYKVRMLMLVHRQE